MLPNELIEAVRAISAIELATLAAKVLGYLGALYGAGAFFALAALPALRGEAERRAVARAAAWALVGLVATAALAPLRAAFLGGAWSASTDRALLELVANSPLGASVAARAVGLLGVAGAALLHRRRPMAGRWVGVLAGVATLVGVALIGHGRATIAMQALAALHICAAAFWLGALSPLERVARTASPAAAAAAMSRFGRVAVYAVSALAAAGVALAISLVGSVHALVESAYGVLLLAKLAVVAALLALAARHKWLLTPALLDAPDARMRLARSIRVERWVAATVVAATAALTTLAGPA